MTRPSHEVAESSRSEFGYEIHDDFFHALSDNEISDSQRTRTPVEARGQHEDPDNMPPTTRQHRLRRTNVVDLTAEPSSPPPASHPRPQPGSLKRSAEADAEPSGQRSTKRPRPSLLTTEDVEEIDLSNSNEAPSADDELIAAAILAQQKEEAGPFRIGKRQCIICLDSYTNATVTHCGHIFCHECLTQALRQGEKNSERGQGSCPVCRKGVKRTGKAPQLQAIAFMTKVMFKKKGFGIHG